MANRYWVGGNQLWDGNAETKWATTSGGTGGASAPTIDDDVFFDTANSWRLVRISTGAECANLTITGRAIVDHIINIGINLTVGNLTINGNSVTNRIFLRSGLGFSETPGAQRTITATTTTLSNIDFQDIIAAGAADWSGTSIGDALNNTGITFTTPFTRYAVSAGSWSSTARWSDTSGGTSGASVPICHDTVIFDANSGTGIYSFNLPILPKTLTLTGFSGTINFTYSIYTFLGDLIIPTTTTISAAFRSFKLAGRGSHTLQSQDAALPFIAANCASGSYTLGSNIQISGFNLVSGAFNSATYNVLLDGDFDGSGGTLNMGSGTWTCYGYFSNFCDTTVGGNTTVEMDCRNQLFFPAFQTGVGGAVYNSVVFKPQSNTAFLLEAYAADQINGLSIVDGSGSSVRMRGALNIESTTLQDTEITGFDSAVPIEFGTADIRRTTISDITSATLIRAKNSTDAGGNTNINFIDVPTNLNTTQSSIINNAITGVGYPWNQINDTWVSAEYTWNNMIQQTPPVGTAITNIQIS